MQERGVDRAQAVLVTLLSHDGSVLPATIASVKLLGDRARGPGRCSASRWWRSSPPTTCRSSATTRPTAAPRAAQRHGRPLRLGAPPGGCCASRSSWARARPARPSSRRLARRLRRLAAARPLPGGAGRPAQRGRHGAAGASRATSWWAPTTTPRTSPASWAPTTAPAARPWSPSSPARSAAHPAPHGQVRRSSTARRRPRGTPDRAVRAARPARQQGGRAALRGRAGDGAARLRGRPAAAASRARAPPTPGCGGGCARPPARPGLGRVFPADDAGRDRSTTTCRSCGRACPSIDLIDFDFPCWHRRCDDLSAVSERSLDASGETVLRAASLASL